MEFIKNVFSGVGRFFSKISDGILNMLYRNSALKRVVAELRQCLANETLLDGMLEVLLKCLSLVFMVDGKFRRNIKNFDATYSFRSMDNKISLAAVFRNNRLKVYGKAIPQSTITIMFKDGKALRDFLFSANPDILQGMLDNKLSYEGNLNYLLKFGYMLKHLQHSFQLA